MPYATPGEAIGTRLTVGATTVASLIGTRVGPSKPAQEPSGDYAVYFGVAGGGGQTLSSASVLAPYLIRIEAVAESQARAEAILKAIRERLAGWQDKANGVHGCFPQPDASERVLDDGSGRLASGQSFKLLFKGP